MARLSAFTLLIDEAMTLLSSVGLVLTYNCTGGAESVQGVMP